MKFLKMQILIFLIICVTPAMSFAQTAMTGMQILKKIDLLLAQIGDISVKVNITQNKVNQGIKNFEALYFRRDATDEFLIIMTKPESDKGNGYLRVGENFWMYRQNTRTFQHINRDESVMGTDAKGGDFEKKKIAELYKVEIGKNGKEMIREEKLGKKDTYRLQVIQKVKDVTYPRQTLWVEKETCLPLKILSYSVSGTLMQTVYYPKYTQIEGRYLAIQVIFIDEFEKGNKSIVDLSGISLRKLDPKMFTKAYLENLSK